MKIGIVCSEGGHLIEALNVIDAFRGHDVFLITYKARHIPVDNMRDKGINRIYRIGYSNSDGILLCKLVTVGAVKILGILLREKPAVLFSTGSEIAVPAFILGKIFLRTKLIFLETLTKFREGSKTGKVLYGFCDKFIIPWKDMKGAYGDKAEFIGEVI